MQPNSSGFSLSSLSIRRHISTLMLTLCLIVVSGFFISTLQVDLLPAITYPRIGVRLEVPGISPEVAIDEVTKPLEEALSATEGVVQLFSQTREGQVSLDLYFQPGGNVDQALNEATAAFNRAQGNLPDVVQSSRLFKIDPSQLPVYELALTSNSLKPVDLRVFADEELGRELGIIEGVAAVDIAGGVEEEVGVEVDLDRLQALNVGLNDVLTELEESNQDVSGGRILGTNAEPLTRAIGRFQDAQDLRDLSFEVGSSGESNETALNRRVYLRDFAQVRDGVEDQRIFVMLNGQDAVKVSIQKQPDANTVDVVDRVKQRIEQLRQSGIVPQDMMIIPTLDESVFIRDAISNVTTSGLIGAVLAGSAVLLFLRSLRQTFIIVSSILLSTLSAVILMRLFGLSLNMFSLGGLALGVGVVVDNSIVMLEAIVEGLHSREDEHQARLDSQQVIDQSISSSQEVESALLASTATNLVSVLPFLFLGGFVSLLFNELILTISFAVAASLPIALTVVPMLTSRLMGIRRSSGVGRLWPLQAFNRRFEAATLSYGNWLDRALNRRVLVVLLTFILLGGSSLLVLGQIPQEILPRIDTGQARLFAQFPPGTPLDTNRQVMQEVDDLLMAQPETEYVFSTVGGNLFGANTTENPLRSSSTIILKPDANVEEYVARMSQEFGRLNLVDILLRLSPGEVRGLILNNSPVRGADVDVILQGEDADILEQTGRQVLRTLGQQATLARYRPDTDRRQPEIQIRLDQARAADLGLNIADVGRTLETAIQGTVATQIQRGNRLVDVRVELEEEDINRPSRVAELPLFTDDNQLVRLGDITQIEEGQAPGQIQRINQRQVFLIAGSLAEGASLSDALAEVDRIMAGIQLPEGVNRLPGSVAESNQQLQAALPILGGLAAFLVFTVMAVQYNSLIDPLVIMFTLPLALAGGIWGLYLTKTAIGATVIVGAVLLVGIVVNNAIVLVELANQIHEKQGVDRRTAMLIAAPRRLRPILMTTITAVLGTFPLALGIGRGSEFLQPLGIVVLSGQALATLLTLFLIPCLYLLLHDFRWTKPGRRPRRRSASPKENYSISTRE